jgi:hypothetical protein
MAKMAFSSAHKSVFLSAIIMKYRSEYTTTLLSVTDCLYLRLKSVGRRQGWPQR